MTTIAKTACVMTHRLKFTIPAYCPYDDEQYILEEKFKLSGMRRKSAFLRELILYGYVYDVDYSFLRNYNAELGISATRIKQTRAS